MLCAPKARAQSWSGAVDSPLLWQIVAIDRSGEPGWPYGSEDIAGDGLSRFNADEAGSDLRSVYADADADRLWLRAYVVSESAPPSAVRAFFFLNTDRESTGGPAYGDALDPALDHSITLRGFDVAVGVGGDGTLLGVYAWDAASSAWSAVDVRPPQAAHAEAGTAPDPLALGALDHGYLQVDLVHDLAQLDQSCEGALFVRLVYDDPASRTFGDAARDDFLCRPPLDAAGDPAVLRTFACTRDADCPADGHCTDGVCLFAYPCTRAADCPSDQTCVANRCVRQVTGTCSSAADCDGLVCDGARCVACSDSGASACPSGLVCSPNGSCVDAQDVGSGGTTLPDGARVQGGAYSCSATNKGSGGALLTSAALLALALGARRRRRALRREPRHGKRLS